LKIIKSPFKNIYRKKNERVFEAYKWFEVIFVGDLYVEALDLKRKKYFVKYYGKSFKVITKTHKHQNNCSYYNYIEYI